MQKYEEVSLILAISHYAEHWDKPYWRELVEFTCSGPTIAMVMKSTTSKLTIKDAVEVKTQLRKAFNAPVASPKNYVHCSDSAKEADREINLWF